ncbi:MAG: acylphosphatase [Ruminococcus sp.]|nr:acylphosphatase [Ruminococcus sp.]
MNKHRFHYIFSGDVQEVGFRSTACRLARELFITGWVKNLWDGTVEMEAQGFSGDIDALISGLRQQLFIMVENIQCEEVPIVHNEDGFHIR